MACCHRLGEHEAPQGMNRRPPRSQPCREPARRFLDRLWGRIVAITTRLVDTLARLRSLRPCAPGGSSRTT
jgi:hypothetical protein